MKVSIFDQTNVPLCPTCKGQIVLDLEKGEEICTGCGRVLVEKMEVNEDNDSDFSGTKHHGRYSQTELSNTHLNIQTRIYGKNVDCAGIPISSKTAEMMARLRKLDSYSVNHKYKRIAKATVKIDRISQRLGLSNIIRKKIITYYTKSVDEKLIKGRSINNFIVASVYLACKDSHSFRSFQQLLSEIGSEASDRRGVKMAVRLIQERLGVKSTMASPLEVLPRIASSMNLSQKTIQKAQEILARVKDADLLSGRNPVFVAGGALLLAMDMTGEHISHGQMAVANAANASIPSIRKTSNMVRDILNQMEQSAKTSPYLQV